ncbi:MAG: type II secretion system protein [Candidatus Gastranaerophilales bacterium]|nr:type II secretion system protein [Candidatus Gastranaerophilales bacterium]
MKKRTGFTLAEVLVVIAIIGIVASIITPMLFGTTNDAELKLAFKKAYSTASQAWLMVVTENPGVYTQKSGWAIGDTKENRPDLFKEKFNVIKSCINETGCWPDEYEYNYLLGNNLNSTKTFSWITADGMCWAAPWYGGDNAHIVVDTNCNKKPNLIGKDIFSFLLGVDGTIYFAIDDKSSDGNPISRGKVGPYLEPPTTINSRSVDFRDWLIN